MSVINVAIPVLRNRMTLIVNKGRPWSVIEHMILEGLARKTRSARELANAGNLPRRVVVESCARLMRAGWVELLEEEGALRFRATPRGEIVAQYPELPSVTVRVKRPASYVVDLVGHDLFRNRDWTLYDEKALRARESSERFVWIDAPMTDVDYNPHEIADLLLDEDEQFIHAEPSGPSQRYAVARVRDGVIDGFPAGRELPELRRAVLAAAATSPNDDASPVEARFSVERPRVRLKSSEPQTRAIQFSLSDLVLDGEAHRQAIKRALAEARSRVMIHSTFVRQEAFVALLPDIAAAVRRGVRVHLFWGQNEDPDGMVSTQVALKNIRRNATVVGLEPLLRIHMFSTGSHAKLLIADNGPDGAYTATVGSCNWLASGFVSYDASVTLRDPMMASQIVEYLSRMSRMHGGVWSELTTELVCISHELERSAKATTPSTNAHAGIVIGAQHNGFVLRARDEARQRVFVASHKLGPVSTSSIVALVAAAKANAIAADVYYGKTRRPTRGADLAADVAAAKSVGVRVAAVEDVRMHAKLLTWDDDNAVVSSLNWLSADPQELDSLNEIGVWISASGVARAIIENFSSARTRSAVRQ